MQCWQPRTCRSSVSCAPACTQSSSSLFAVVDAILCAFPFGMFLLAWIDAVMYQDRLLLFAGSVAMLCDWTGV